MKIVFRILLYKIFTFVIFISFVTNNGFAINLISKETVISDSNEKLKLVFSHKRNLYDASFELIITSNNVDAAIIYTLDCSKPSNDNGIVYQNRIYIDSTIVVKAIAVSANCTSKVYTHSYIFPAISARQGNKPEGFPGIWRGSSNLRADYGMDTSVINHPNYKFEIIKAFKSIPTLSLTMNIDEWFDKSIGLYVGYPDSNVAREKAITAEFIFNDSEKKFSVECGIQNQGGTSIINWMVPKQSMRLLFKDIYGPKKLKKRIFPNSNIESINTLVIDGFLNTWLHPWHDEQRISSIFFRDQLTSDLHNAMGRLSFHGLFIHLFVNGLYWGLYDLHERPDDAFLAEYLNAKRKDFDIIKQRPKIIVQGSNKRYLEMLEVARKGLDSDKELELIQEYLNLPDFIDYMILNFYLGNNDWAHHNYYAARNKKLKTGFRFYTWDSEHVINCDNVSYDNTLKNDKDGPTEIHTLLKENKKYRMMFADAVYKHCYNNGALEPGNFEKIFLLRKNEIETAVILESARWGDFHKNISGVTYTKKHWDDEINKILMEYIPFRRDIVLKQFQDKSNRLFPVYMPPVIKVHSKGSKSSIFIELINPNSVDGDIYYTTNESNPWLKGDKIRGKKYNELVKIKRGKKLKARFCSKSGVWSALAEK